MSEVATMRRKEAESLATDVLGETPSGLESPLTVLASPAWRGVEGDIWRASSQDRSIILKHYHDDTFFYVDQGPAILAAEEAGRLGVGPKVLRTAVNDCLLVLTDLTSPWVAGGLHHALDPELRSAVISQKKAYLQALYDDPGFAPIRAMQEDRQARERVRFLAIVCTDNPYAAVWQPAEGTCEQFASKSGN